jgi:hypothetical protein
MTAPFFHARRLGDPRPLPAGLPVCTCGVTFEPTRKGQRECIGCLGTAGPETQFATTSVSIAEEPPAKVVRIKRRRGLGSSPLGGER